MLRVRLDGLRRSFPAIPTTDPADRPMTYNFDPDRWYDNQRVILEHRRSKGEIDAEEFERLLALLEERYDQMQRRLDSSFELPPSRTNRQS